MHPPITDIPPARANVLGRVPVFPVAVIGGVGQHGHEEGEDPQAEPQRQGLRGALQHHRHGRLGGWVRVLEHWTGGIDRHYCQPP